MLVTLPLSLIAAIGHGPAPSPLAILVESDGRPEIVSTNIGLAVRNPSTSEFDYVCPWHWGGLETPLVAALGASEVLVVGADAVVGSEDRGCSFQPRDGPSTADIGAIVQGEERIYVLFGGEAWVWPGGEILSLADAPLDSAIEVEGRIWAAGARPLPVLIRGGDAEALGVEGLQRASLRQAEEAIYLTGPTAEGSPLFRWREGRWEEVARADLSVHGPVRLCGADVAVLDGVLTVVRGEPDCDLSPWAGRRLTCLGRVGDLPYTCELRRLRRLPDGEVVFELTEIAGPREGCPPNPDDRLLCELDWLHFGAEAGLLREGAVDGDAGAPWEEEADGEAECGCGVVSLGRSWLVRR